MVHILECIGIGASYYNLALVLVLVILYINLLRLPAGKIFIKPWRYIFGSLCVYIVEEIITLLEAAALIKPPAIIFPIFEFFIIVLFIYALLTLREHIKVMAK